MYHDLLDVVAVEALRFREEKLQLWNTFLGQPIMLVRRKLQLSASMVSWEHSSAASGRGRKEIVRRLLGPSSDPLRVNSRCPRALSQRARIQRLRTEGLPVLACGNAVWHLRKEVLRGGAGTFIRSARIGLHLSNGSFRPFVWRLSASRAPSGVQKRQHCEGDPMRPNERLTR